MNLKKPFVKNLIERNYDNLYEIIKDKDTIIEKLNKDIIKLKDHIKKLEKLNH